MGMPYEGAAPEAMARTAAGVDVMRGARLGAGTYTDDTEMMIGLAETLVRHGRVDQDDLANAFVNNLSPHRGYGPGSMAALRLIEEGTPWAQAAQALFPDGSMGNGAAMRIAPVGVMFHHDHAMLLEQAELSASVTHCHLLGVEGARLQALAVGLSAGTGRDDDVDTDAFLKKIKGKAGNKDAVEAIEAVSHELNLPHDPSRVAESLGTSALAMRSVPAAIYSFLRFSSDFKTAVSMAVALGGDTDTIGAMTGAIAGACRGVGAIPGEWVSALENGNKGRDYVLELGNALYDKWRERNVSRG